LPALLSKGLIAKAALDNVCRFKNALQANRTDLFGRSRHRHLPEPEGSPEGWLPESRSSTRDLGIGTNSHSSAVTSTPRREFSFLFPSDPLGRRRLSSLNMDAGVVDLTLVFGQERLARTMKKRLESELGHIFQRVSAGETFLRTTIWLFQKRMPFPPCPAALSGHFHALGGSARLASLLPRRLFHKNPPLQPGQLYSLPRASSGGMSHVRVIPHVGRCRRFFEIWATQSH